MNGQHYTLQWHLTGMCQYFFDWAHSTNHSVHNTQHTARTTQYTIHSKQHEPLSTQYTANSTNHSVHNTQQTARTTQYTIHSKQHEPLSTQYTANSTNHSVHNTQQTARTTQYTIHSKQQTAYILDRCACYICFTSASPLIAAFQCSACFLFWLGDHPLNRQKKNRNPKYVENPNFTILSPCYKCRCTFSSLQ